jgi:hypothetical protein
MDKQGRLTEWEEWEIGAHYNRFKPGRKGFTIGAYRCVSVKMDDHIIFANQGSPDDAGFRQFNWQGRFIKVAKTNSENDKTLTDKEF